jgi:lysophospholipase L1-like esterase
VNVFYDENGDGVRGSDESAVVPNADVTIGGQHAVSQAGTGYAALDGVPAGADPVTLGSLPPFYTAGAPVSLTVPQPPGVDFNVPVDLPIGSNQPGVYMAYGDSITDGDGSYDLRGYRGLLQPQLQAHFGQGTINNQAASGTRSKNGANRITRVLPYVAPAYVLILYGTNDWNDGECRDDFPCYTIDSLRAMIRDAKARQTLPVISSIIPCNTGYDARTPPERNVWVSDMNALIKPMALEEGAVYVDAYSAFMAVPDFHALFSDHVHPNDAGYRILADQWFKAISQPAATAQGHEIAPPVMPPPGRFYGDPGRVMGPNEE